MTAGHSPSRWRTWRWPVVLAIVSIAGLLSALLGDGWWDAASWVALGLPIVVCVRYGLRIGCVAADANRVDEVTAHRRLS